MRTRDAVKDCKGGEDKVKDEEKGEGRAKSTVTKNDGGEAAVECCG